MLGENDKLRSKRGLSKTEPSPPVIDSGRGLFGYSSPPVLACELLSHLRLAWAVGVASVAVMTRCPPAACPGHLEVATGIGLSWVPPPWCPCRLPFFLYQFEYLDAYLS